MKCFSPHAHNERIYDVLSGTKNVLEVGKCALEVLPVPGLAPVADVLIALIARVEVRLCATLIYVWVHGFSLGAAEDSRRPRRTFARDFIASERHRDYRRENRSAHELVSH